jgi:hypothetical protein
MTTEEVTCRVLMIKPYGNDDNVSLAEKSAQVCLKDCPNTAIETRLLWAPAIPDSGSYRKIPNFTGF